MLKRGSCLKVVLGMVGMFCLFCTMGFPGAGSGFGGAGIAFAQGTAATLSGTITDQSGAVVPDVKIVLRNLGTGWHRTTAANREGYYAFPLLPAGRYALVAERPGFARVTVNDVVMEVSINSTVNILLEPGAVTESVLVEANSNRIDLSGATRAVSVTNEQVSNLPVFTTVQGRSVLTILPFLVPGVIPTNPLAGVSPSLTGRRGSSLSINGGRAVSVSYNFEGGDNNDSVEGLAASPLPNPDALQEFTVVTSNYQADLGRSAGGVINAIAKRGTDTFHGNLRYFLLNEGLNARSFFDPGKPLRNRLNTFGGQIGGPVAKGRTHFFFDYEASQLDRVPTENVSSVFTPAERSGDFSALPSFLWPNDPLTGVAFPGGIIPQSRFDPIAVRYLELVPLPNDAGRIFRTESTFEQTSDQFTIQGEHQFSSSDSLSVTYFSQRDETVFSTIGFPTGLANLGRNRSKNLVLRETHVFSPQAVNQFTGTINRRTEISLPRSGSLDGIAPSDWGIQTRPQTDNFLTPPQVFITSPFMMIVPMRLATTRAQTTWQVKDDFSFTRGKHSLKVGGEVRGFLLNATQSNDNGFFSFFGINLFGTGNALANFLLGFPDIYGQDTGNTMWPRQNAYSLYLMDEWRVRPNLTLNLGLRYELVPPLRDEQDQVSVFRPGSQSQVIPVAPEGILFVGDPDPVLGTVPRAGYPTDKNNFAPRVSIAYSPQPQSGFLRALFGKGKTAIRAGGGVFYDQTYGRSFTQSQFIQPFAVSEAVFSFFIPGATFANPFGSQPNNWPLDLSERVFLGPPMLQPFDPGFRTAYTYQYNLTIQREMPWALLFEVGYVGNNSFKLNREQELNLGIVGPGATSGNLSLRRTYSQLGSIPSQESSGRAQYNSFQVRLVRKFSGGLSFDGSYVFGKSLDDSSAPLTVRLSPSFAPGWSAGFPLSWARSNFDRKHSFTASYTYRFPTTSRGGALGRLLNGWQIGGTTQLRSGLPLDITQTFDSTLTGESGVGRPDLVGAFERFSPREETTVTIFGFPLTGHFFFNPNAFQVFSPADYTEARRGTLPRNIFSGPGQNMTSLSIIKRTTVAESHTIELRADINNFFNHANFFTPGLDASNPFFLGRVFFASPGRTIQLALRYAF